MKLGKLLGAGKSFFGGQGVVTYRENKQVYLPKFNPGKIPLRLEAGRGRTLRRQRQWWPQPLR